MNGSTLTGALTWNQNGSLGTLQITDPFNSANSQTCGYLYDSAFQVAHSACASTWFQHFDYGPFENLFQSGTQSFLPTYNQSTNRYSGLPGGGTPRYDNNGNLMYDGFHNYTWTAEGQNATVSGGGISSVAYDAMGRWMERTYADGSHDQAVYGPQGGTPLFIANAGTLKTGYLHLPGNGSLTYYPNGTLLYGHPDWLGTGRLFSNNSRQVVADTAIAPYGQQYANTGSTDGFFTGVGQSTEATDIQTFPARLYHPQQGRWLTPDPAGLDAVDITNPRTWNRYAYAANNPLANVDPRACIWSPRATPIAIAASFRLLAPQTGVIRGVIGRSESELVVKREALAHPRNQPPLHLRSHHLLRHRCQRKPGLAWPADPGRATRILDCRQE